MTTVEHGRGPFDLSGRVAIVTGGARGIGLGIVEQLGRAGADVLFTVRDAANGRAALERLAHVPGGRDFTVCDVAEPTAGEIVVQACIDRFGRVDSLVNNAGVFPRASLDELDATSLDEVTNVNYRAVVLLSQAAARHMRARAGAGSIVNITSIDAYRPSVPGYLAYGASKAAALQATRIMAAELAPFGIRVNAVSPGVILGDDPAIPPEVRAMFAELVPLGRVGRPDEIGAIVVFLASDASSFVTGADIIADGGKGLQYDASSRRPALVDSQGTGPGNVHAAPSVR